MGKPTCLGTSSPTRDSCVTPTVPLDCKTQGRGELQGRRRSWSGAPAGTAATAAKVALRSHATSLRRCPSVRKLREHAQSACGTSAAQTCCPGRDAWPPHVRCPNVQDPTACCTQLRHRVTDFTFRRTKVTGETRWSHPVLPKLFLKGHVVHRGARRAKRGDRGSTGAHVTS